MLIEHLVSGIMYHRLVQVHIIPGTLWYNMTACAHSLYVRVPRWKQGVQHPHPRRVHRYGFPSHVVYGVDISTAAVAKRAAAVAAAIVAATVAAPTHQTSPRSDVPTWWVALGACIKRDRESVRPTLRAIRFFFPK